MERPVTVIKLGSTTLSMLSAVRLDAPRKREQAVLHLIRRSPDEARQAVCDAVNAWMGELGPVFAFLAGAGQVWREWGETARLPWPVWILSGREEARLAWIAVAAVVRESPLVVDIGGGSTELVSARLSCSLPIGVGRPGPLRWPEERLTGRVTLIGGLGHVLGTLSGRGPGELISAAGFHRLYAEVKQRDTQELVARGVEPDRAPLVARGFEILASLLAAYGWDSLVWAERGLLEGLWLAASLGRGHPFGSRLDRPAAVCQDRR